MTGHSYGYARVSTAEQDPSLQIDALRSAGCVRTFLDKASGKLDRRPQLDQLLDTVLAGDTIVVWKLDRLGRRTARLLQLIDHLGATGVGFRSLTENVDTSSAQGRAMLAIIGAFAELERDMTVERTRAGLAAAAARGKRVGRPPALSADQVTAARQMHSEGRSVADVARLFRVSRPTVYRALDAGAAEPVKVQVASAMQLDIT